MKAVESMPQQPDCMENQKLLVNQQDQISKIKSANCSNPQTITNKEGVHAKIFKCNSTGSQSDITVDGPECGDNYSRVNSENLLQKKYEDRGDVATANGGTDDKYNSLKVNHNGLAKQRLTGDYSIHCGKDCKQSNGEAPKSCRQNNAPVETSRTNAVHAEKPEGLSISPHVIGETCPTNHGISNGVRIIKRFEGKESRVPTTGFKNGFPEPNENACVNGDSTDNSRQSNRLHNGDNRNDQAHCNLLNGHDPDRSESPTTTWDRAVAEVKEQAFARLQEELRKAHQELRLRDEEVNRLSRIREEVEAELEELTASLFQEAHNMVREANVRQAAAERSYKESQMQVEVLMAEVAALKTLVLTSTPSRPNPHLHPQIDPRSSRSRDDTTVTGVSLFNRKHRRSPSHFNLKYGRENSPPASPVKEQRPAVPEPVESKDGWEVDPNIHKEFVSWKQNPKMDKSDPFIARVYNEDINLCLDFTNKELGKKVQEAIEEGNIFIEAVSDKTKTVFPKKCALLEAPRQCHYRMKLGDHDQWYYISQICRNRITAVCDFLNYLRYIERGLVKSSVHDVYWEITRLRKEMVLARLGLGLAY